MLLCDPSSPLSLPLDVFNASVPSARLSLLLLATAAQLKYPPFSILRIGGGEPARGEAMELYPLLLALLDPFRLFLPLLWTFDLRIAFMSEACAGENVAAVAHMELGVVGMPNGVVALLGF